MPIVKVYGVPSNMCNDNREALERTLVRCCNEIETAVAQVQALKLTTEQTTVFFPTDLMRAGSGAWIIVEITGLFQKPERTHEVLNEVAKRVGEAVKCVLSPELPQLWMIEVLIYVFAHDSNGYHHYVDI